MKAKDLIEILKQNPDADVVIECYEEHHKIKDVEVNHPNQTIIIAK